MLSIYLDTNIVSGLAKADLDNKTMKLALEIVQRAKKGEVKLLTSELTEDEISQVPEEVRYHHLIIYSLIKNVALIAERFGSFLVTGGLGGGNLITKGLGPSPKDPLFVKLEKIIPKPSNERKANAMDTDIRHIFQCKKNEVDVFWTEDKRTILNKKNELEKLGINVMSTGEVVEKINASDA